MEKTIKVTLMLLIILSVFYIGFLKFRAKEYPKEYNTDIITYSNKYHLNEDFVRAIIKAESGFDKNARSKVNAKGLMQITDTTGQWIASSLNVKNFTGKMLYEPKINIEFGCWYLSFLSKEFDGNEKLVIAAYNAGQGNVKNWLSNPNLSNGKELITIPFPETKDYVKEVLRYEKYYGYLYNGVNIMY